MVAVPSIGRADQLTPQRRAREADATRRLYEQYARQIYSYCFHQLGSREEAEDATQSTFLNAFRGFQRGIDPEFESAWLYKIAQNVCLTRQRSSSRRRRVETPGDLEAMQDVIPAREVDSDDLFGLPQALEGMPEQQRRALLLREWQGLTYKEIADELGISQGAVETLLFRARRTLAAGLTEEPKQGFAKRLKSGDLGSAFAILKSLVLTGGAKVAATVATVAATSVVAATPGARHAVENAVAFSPVAHHSSKPAVVVHTPAASQANGLGAGSIGHSVSPQVAVPVGSVAQPAAHGKRVAAPKLDRGAGAVTKLVIGVRPTGSGKAPAEPTASTPTASAPAAPPVTAPVVPAPAAASPAAPAAQPKSGGDGAKPAAAAPQQTGTTDGNGSSGGDKGTSGSDSGSSASGSSSGGGDSAKGSGSDASNGSGGGGSTTEKKDPPAASPPVAAPPAAAPPAAPPANSKTDGGSATMNGPKDSGDANGNGNGNANGNGNGNANGKDKSTPAPAPPVPAAPPVVAPPVVAAPVAPVSPPAATPPAPTTTTSAPAPSTPADQGNGKAKDNGSANGNGSSNGNGNSGNSSGNGKKK